MTVFICSTNFLSFFSCFFFFWCWNQKLPNKCIWYGDIDVRKNLPPMAIIMHNVYVHAVLHIYFFLVLLFSIVLTKVVVLFIQFVSSSVVLYMCVCVHFVLAFSIIICWICYFSWHKKVWVTVATIHSYNVTIIYYWYAWLS